jgi:glucosamine 6-phosphate synthetase-like amidotransferase/phosphosugar isomerase protein
MCGIFGLMLPTDTHDEVPAQAMVTLGVLAERRGIDAAGLGFWTGAADTGDTDPAAVAGRPAATLDGWRIRKRLGRFRDLPRRELAGELRGARVVLGHTRYAVQGDPYRLDNAGPWAVGRLLGTYCGDVDAAALRRRYRLEPSTGDTDAAAVLGVLAAAADLPAGPDSVAALDLLRALRGEAALAWVVRSRPDRLWLARGAGAPLAVAFTVGGAALWASDPEWLRQVAFSWGLPLTGDGPQMVPEGTLLALGGGRKVRTCGRWRFEPAATADLRAAA